MKTNLLLIAVIGTFICSEPISSQTWLPGMDILHAVRGGNITSYSDTADACLLIVSGRDEAQVIKTTQRYSTVTNKWDTLSPHPTGLLGAATTFLNGNLYIIGGVINPPGFGQDTVYRLNIKKNTWTKVAPYPYAIVDAKAIGYQDSLIYTAGGIGETDSASVLLYNSITDTWRKATTIPSATGLNFGGFTRAGDKLIYICGTDGFGSTNYFNTVYVGTINQTDHAHITWKKGAEFPGKTRSFFDAHPWINNSLIMTGGSTDNTFDTWSDECYTFDPQKDTWTKLTDKPTAWITGQSGTVKRSDNTWELICAGGYDTAYIHKTELFKQSEVPNGIPSFEKKPAFSLFQNNPNPFKNNTTIHYTIHNKNEHITLTIYDALGHVVDTLVNQKQSEGDYTVDSHSRLLAGIYYYKLTAGDHAEIKKMVCVNE